MPPPAWQQHHHMQWLTINPYRKQREGLTIQGMGRISNRDLTTDLV
jgi:hypothetical protein